MSVRVSREAAHKAWGEWVLSPEGRAVIPGQTEVAHQEAFIAGYLALASRLDRATKENTDAH